MLGSDGKRLQPCLLRPPRLWLSAPPVPARSCGWPGGLTVEVPVMVAERENTLEQQWMYNNGSRTISRNITSGRRAINLGLRSNLPFRWHPLNPRSSLPSPFQVYHRAKSAASKNHLWTHLLCILRDIFNDLANHSAPHKPHENPLVGKRQMENRIILVKTCYILQALKHICTLSIPIYIQCRKVTRWLANSYSLQNTVPSLLPY